MSVHRVLRGYPTKGREEYNINDIMAKFATASFRSAPRKASTVAPSELATAAATTADATGPTPAGAGGPIHADLTVSMVEPRKASAAPLIGDGDHGGHGEWLYNIESLDREFQQREKQKKGGHHHGHGHR